MSPIDGNLQSSRVRLQLVGQVQGMGFRPFVLKLATSLGLVGSVYNTDDGVVIEVQGDELSLSTFKRKLQADKPVYARIEIQTETRVKPANSNGFEIGKSRKNADSHAVPFVLPDLAMCDLCHKELLDPQDRRFHYPFIHCTGCGPRYTIMRDVPYDRSQTTMSPFPMCGDCEQEYHDPANRRFHAEPISCPQCGPRIWFVADNQVDSDVMVSASDVMGDRALIAFRAAINQGKIVAVKGVGGFHLVCDAYDTHAVERLRKRKGRSAKPFAIMVASLADAKSFADMSVEEERTLLSHVAPIVIMRTVDRSIIGDFDATMLDHVAPETGNVGVMLPYSPLHALLMKGFRALVMTSANLSDEPIVSTNEDARNRLDAVADAYLLHDREIAAACDDPVMRWMEVAPSPIRLGRGLIPSVLPLRSEGPCVLAVGGDLKSAFCFAQGNHAYMSAHVGDLSTPGAVKRLHRDIAHFERLFRLTPAAVAADLHPGYHSREFAVEYAETRGIPLIEVQHHEAHAASLMAEHAADSAAGEMIACCFDGTGYARDGSIWGGEFFVIDSNGTQHFAQLQSVRMPGGDACVQKPARAALAYLFHNGVAWTQDLPPVANATGEELRVLRQQVERNLNCVSCSSAGRLFDAAASLLGLSQAVSYEAEAAMKLEAVATGASAKFDFTKEMYRLRQSDRLQSDVLQIDHEPLIQWLTSAETRRLGIEYAAALFHHSIADMIVAVCVQARKQSGINRVGLSGGVFQNQLLVRLTRTQLSSAGFEICTHRCVPANDGGLALGQAVLARQHLRQPQ